MPKKTARKRAGTPTSVWLDVLDPARPGSTGKQAISTGAAAGASTAAVEPDANHQLAAAVAAPAQHFDPRSATRAHPSPEGETSQAEKSPNDSYRGEAQ